MDSFQQMNIFFFVTTVITVVNGVFVAAILFAVWRIVKYAEMISKEVSEESVLIRSDIARMRERVQYGGFAFKHIFPFIKESIFKRYSSRPGRKKKSDSEDLTGNE